MELEDELREEITALQHQLIEAENKIARSRSRDNLVRQAANIGYWDFTPATDYLQWSPEMLPLASGLGSGELDITYENFTKFVHQDDIEEVDRIIADATEKRIPFSIEYRVEHVDGSKHWLKGWGGSVEDNDGMQRMIGAVMDITEQKENEIALINAKEEADKANRAKSEFLSTMSHELRTPLNAILGFGQLLKRGSQNELSGNQMEQVDQILDGGNHLVQLINEILELSHIESGTMVLNIEDVPIADILKECQSLMSIIASENGIDILVIGDALEELYAHVDYARFKQVLINLMSNAIKYNRPNGKVIINAEQITDSMLRLSISDTGYGIPDHKHQELFKPFSRLGAETSDIEGTGIGLVVCKDLIEVMGGTIGVESKEDKGSTFWVEVPIANPSNNSSVATSEPSPVSEEALPSIKGTLLYVEDSPVNITLMEFVVEDLEGLLMLTATTGKEGIKKARQFKPDIIILDINLPDMSGIEVLKELRRHDETRTIPTLAMSAAATKGDIDKGLDAGFLQYLTKPIQVSEVVEAISAAMKVGSGERSD